jgi:PAS domain S-box-containing protein
LNGTTSRSRLFGWSVAIAALLAAVLLRWLLDPVMGDALPLVTVFGAVAAAVWAGGFVPALVVAVLGYVACEFLFIAPRGSLLLGTVGDLVGMLAYTVTCALVIVVGEAARAAQARAASRSEVLRVTLASIGDGVITTDLGGRVTYLNAVAEALTGWRDGEARGRPLGDVFRILHEETRVPVETPVARALREGVVVGLANHTVLAGRDGVERAIDDSAAPIRDERGRVAGCVLIFRDVSERRRLEREEANRALDARLLAAIVESSDDAIVSKSLDGVIRSWNAGAERLFGYTAAEAVGRHISLIIPPDRLTEEDRIIASLKAGNRVEHFETERMRRDGATVHVSLTISPIRDQAGTVVGASKIARDITGRKLAEAEREELATLVENSSDFIGICDPEGVPRFVNRAGLDLVGLDTLEDARRVNVRDFFFPEDQARMMERFFPAVVEHGKGEMEVRFRNFRTGEARWMVYKVLKLTDGAGKTTAFATVSHDVTGRKRLEDGLRKLAADLSDADRRKTEFLATLSHELRNPLAPLTHLIEVLRRTGDDARLRHEALDTMSRQLEQLVRLVGDLLDLNRITHNRLELRREPVELALVLRQAVESSLSLAEFAGHQVDVTAPSEPIRLEADPVRLAQVFGNLIHNACKYTAAGGRIRVVVERSGDEAVVTVADTGIGIPPEDLDRIFEMFTQVHTADGRSHGGLGIGLSLVKRLVELHGGEVEARSEGRGKGSTFVVRLPLAPDAQAPWAPTVPAAARGATAGRRVLVVDDNEDASAVLSLLLKMGGADVREARDGPSALAEAEAHRPDVVLLDIGLPALDGYEVCRRIRQQPWGKDPILIALTGWGQDEDRRVSREAGFDAHLVKPVDFPALTALIESLSASRPSRPS